MDFRRSSQVWLQDRCNYHHTGVDELPYDILFILFTLCRENEEGGKEGAKGKEKRAPHFPTIASHVCRTWRQCALATPTFWTVLEFRQRLPAFQKYQTWLKRSEDHPLDIVLGPEPFKGGSIKHAKAILRLTVPHIRRWRSISTDGLPAKIVRLIFDRIDQCGLERLEMLETVKVVEVDRPLGPRSEMYRRGWRFKPFSNTKIPPKLRHIVIEGASAQYFTGRFKIFQVWGTLHQFNRHHYKVDVPHIYNLLSSLPNLQTLRVVNRRFARWPVEPNATQSIAADPMPLLTHHSLTELTLQVPQEFRNATLSFLTLPNLRYLLDRRRKEPALGVCCLRHMSQHRPFPRLISLRLAGNNSSRYRGLSSSVNATNVAQLEGALAGLPELKTLTFDHVDFEGGSAQFLDCVGRVCPWLRCLILVRCTGYTPGGLVLIAERRMEGEGLEPLVRIVVQNFRMPDGDAGELEDLKRLVEFEFIDYDGCAAVTSHEATQREWVKSMGY